MVTRRTESIQWRNASNGRSAFLRRSSHGNSMSLDTMVDKATASTITMPVAADAPPMNASNARLGWASAKGRLMTKESEITVPGSNICPARAIGTTNSAARARYRGTPSGPCACPGARCFPPQ